MDNNVFWLKNPTVLINNYLRFIPTKNMSTIQKYNSITLFCLYAIILMILFNKSIYYIYLPFIVIIIVIIMYYIGDRKISDDKETFEPVIETDKTDVTYSCRKPTPNNPFMNPPISDYNKESIPVACNSDDKDINNEINKSFNSGLFLNIDDLFDKMNSQRQFYTVPNTAIPNNQTEFANWLYRAPVTCKEDQEKCLRYEDLRFKR
jgi:hypothetical protein